MIKKSSLSYRIFIAVFLNIVIWFFIIFGAMSFFITKITLENIEKTGRTDVKILANNIDMVLEHVQNTADTVSAIISTDIHNKQFLFDSLHALLKNNKDIYGTTISFEPYAFDNKQKFFAPYFYKKDDKILFMRLGREAYDYFKWDWYKIPKKEHKGVWIDPYFDEGAGNILMTTYSAPFYETIDGKKVFAGVVTADVSLEWIKDLVPKISFGKKGKAFVISKKDRKVLAFKDEKAEEKKTMFESAQEFKDRKIDNILEDMILGKTGFVSNINFINDQQEWISYSSLETVALVIGMVYPEKEVMGPLYIFHSIILLIGIVGAIVIILSISFVAKSIIRPLQKLVETTISISEGNLDAQVPHGKINDEIEALAVAFETMKISLKEYIEKLKETTKREQRIASELSIAHDIQMSIVPKIFPPFPDDERFDIYSQIEPAREVGGDFYDFFQIDENRICFVIGDVSGKGIPASLFMAVSKTLLKATALAIDDPSEIFNRVNKELVDENDKFLFVTGFLGILNIATGELVFSNAGHDNPFLLRKTGQIKPLENVGGMVLGIERKAEYDTSTEMIEKGDKIFLFTDGVSEAMNAESKRFEIENIEKTLKRAKDLSIKEIVNLMYEDIKDFAGDMSQYDDITMMCMELKENR